MIFSRSTKDPFDISWHLSFHKLKFYGTAGQVYRPASSFVSNWRFLVVLRRKSCHGCPVNTGVPQCSILGSAFFRLYINDLPDYVIFNIAVSTDDISLHCKCDLVSE